MHPQLDRTIARLRRRLFLLATAQGICWGLGLVALIGILALGADRFIVLPRLPRQALGALALVVVLLVMIWMVRNARRPAGYLAQWLDVENRFDDRLASAYEFVREGDQDPWKLNCVAQTVAILGQTSLRLPRVPLTRLEWPALSVAMFCIVFAVSTLLQRAKPEADAKSKVVIAPQQAAAERARIDATAKEATELGDRATQDLANKMRSLVDAAADGAKKEDLLRDVASLRRAVDALDSGAGAPPEAGALPANSLVEGARSAVKQGDLKTASAMLGQAAEALQKGDLTQHETEALSDLVKHLGQLGERSGKPDGALTDAVEALKYGDVARAAKDIAQAAPKVNALGPAVRQQELHQRLASELHKLDRELSMPANVLGENEGAPGDPGKGKGSAPVAGNPGQSEAAKGEGSNQRGSSPLASDVRTRPTQPLDATKDLALVGEANGKTIREIYAGSSSGEARPVLDTLVAAHERVAEARLDREDVPDDYRRAVFNYFEAIRHAGEVAWKSTSK